VQILKRHKAAIGWHISDLKGITPSYCIHNINLEADYKPVTRPQRRLNPLLKEEVRKEVLKLLEAGSSIQFQTVHGLVLFKLSRKREV